MVKKSTSIADLIFNIRLGREDVPEGVDRAEFIEYLEKIREAEYAAIERADRIFSRKQASIITLSTVVMALCAILALILEVFKRG